MTETQRIKGLFNDLYSENPWLDVTIIGTLSNISAETAAKKPGNINSIWEITNHLISWRENVLRRLNGEMMVTPSHNYFVPIEDISEKAWATTLKNLSVSQKKWMDFLQHLSDSKLSDIYPPNGHRHYEHIHGILQHDAYHLGQIVLIAKHLV